ncbi:MAG: phosphoenolpyruvate carboxykinase [Thermovirgaceae bacterium]|nr:phosphoenolpyruvate carboxykinase [Thermovirgaceae bacterium]
MQYQDDHSSFFEKLLHPVSRSLLRDISDDELRAMAMHELVPNNQGSSLYVTRIRSRSAAFTEVVYDIDEALVTLLEQVWGYLRWQQMIRVAARIGSADRQPLYANLYVTRRYARIAQMFAMNFSVEMDQDYADLVTVVVPEWHQRKVIVMPRQRVTYILGSDYYGEAKMATLRIAMHLGRENMNGLGLHAGSKIVRVSTPRGLEEKGLLIFGLSGTGKTTITTADHGLVAPEGVEVLQDDINILLPNGSALGSEANFYIKTDNVTKQPPLLRAARDRSALIENCWVDDDGEIDFDNHAITTNGRAVVPRDAIPNTSKRIDLDRVDCLLFNMRRYDIPPIGRLVSAEQAAAFFMLGESTITSAEDPSRVGQAKRVVGFDPFIMDNPHINGNRLLRILRDNPDIRCYVLNTGRIGGKDGANMTPDVTFAAIRGALGESIEWYYDDILGYEIPKTLDIPEASSYDPYTWYSREEYAGKIGTLRRERKEYLVKFKGLAPEIIDSV